MSLFLPFVLPVAFWVAWSDMARMKIPNKAVLALLGIYVVVGPFALPLESYLWHYLHFAVVLVAGFIITSAGLGRRGRFEVRGRHGALHLRRAPAGVSLPLRRGDPRRLRDAPGLPGNPDRGERPARLGESFNRKDFPDGSRALSGALVALPSHCPSFELILSKEVRARVRRSLR